MKRKIEFKPNIILQQPKENRWNIRFAYTELFLNDGNCDRQFTQYKLCIPA